VRVATDHRDVIIQTAARLFARKKFHEVLMDDVADKAGIAKGTIYRYFPNKNELFAALSVQWLQYIGSELEKIAASKTPPIERLRRMLQRCCELVQENDDYFQVMMRHECELWANRKCEFTQRRGVLRDHFAGVIKEAHERKELYCPFDPRHAADMLMGMMRSLLRFSQPRPSPSELADMVLHVFVNGLSTRNGVKS